MAAISNDDFRDNSITENWNCPKSRFQRAGSKKNQKPSLFSDPRRKSCITEFEADLGKSSQLVVYQGTRLPGYPVIFQLPGTDFLDLAVTRKI